MAQIFKVAQKAFVIDKTKKNILLIRYLKSKFQIDGMLNKLGFPGGRVEFGEDLDIAIIREVKEETELSSPQWYPIDKLKKEEFIFDEWPAITAYKNFIKQNPFQLEEML